MGWGFWRHPVEGKHALGPAVTAIPSRPLAARPLPASVPVRPPAPVETDVRAAAPPQLPPPAVASGEVGPLTSVPPDAVVVATPAPAEVRPAIDDQPGAAAPAAPLPETADAVYDEIAQLLLTGAGGDADAVLAALPPGGRTEVLRRLRVLAPPVLVPQQASRAPDLLDLDLVDLDLLDADLPHVLPEADEPPDPPRTGFDPGPQVQLTFRDGTSTSLDPSSDTGQALQQLALSLTRRD